MDKNEARKHHYIPRFILKNFNDENGQVNYWNMEKNALQKRNIKSVFMNIDMYRDEDLNKDDPTQIESKFSVFECEIADLISKKMLTKDEIVLNRNELQKLRIFTELLSFRSDLRLKQYRDNLFDESTRQILLEYQPDGDFEKLWKRELDDLASCRTFEEIEKSTIVDPIIKQEFINALRTFYITIVDSRGGEFLLSDVYPTLEIFPMPLGNLHMHCMFPLSPTRLLILNNIVFKKDYIATPLFMPMVETMRKTSKIQGNAIIPPTSKLKKIGFFSGDDEFTYKVRKIYKNDVEYINALFLNEARVGLIFKDKKTIAESIISFNHRDDIKQKFDKLEEELTYF